MKLHAQKGQALIFMLIVLPAILLFMASKIKLLDLGSQKITIQKEADAYALDLATQQARALNAIAAYNQGIAAAQKQAFLYASAMVATSACGIFANPACIKAALKLKAGAPSFFRKVEKLANHMAEKQDHIKQWSESQIRPHLSPLALFQVVDSKQFELDIFRLGERECTSESASDETCFGQGQDVLKCNEKGPYTFNAIIKSLNFSTQKQKGHVENTYRSISSGNILKRTVPLPLKLDAMPQTIKVNGEVFKHQFGTIVRCFSFYDLMGKINKLTPGSIKFPKPYILGPRYLENKKTLTIKATAVSDRTSKVEVLESVAQPIPLTVLSTALIKGVDLNEMTFKTKLVPNPEEKL